MAGGVLSPQLLPVDLPLHAQGVDHFDCSHHFVWAQRLKNGISRRFRKLVLFRGLEDQEINISFDILNLLD